MHYVAPSLSPLQVVEIVKVIVSNAEDDSETVAAASQQALLGVCAPTLLLSAWGEAA